MCDSLSKNMPVSNRKSIYGILGKPVASSTPIKGLYDTNIKIFTDVKKKKKHKLESGGNKLLGAGQFKSINICEHQVIQNHLEIVSSELEDSDSDVMPYKKTKLISPKANRCSATSMKNAMKNKNLGKAERSKALTSQKKEHTTEESSLSRSENEVISPSHSNTIRSRKPQLRDSSSEKSDVEVVNHKDGDRMICNTLSKRPGRRLNNSQKATTDLHLTFCKKVNKLQNDLKKISASSKVSSSSGVRGNSSVAHRSKRNLSSDHESSSDNSYHEENYQSNSRKPLTKEGDLRQKNKFTTSSTDKIITKTLVVNLSSISHKQNEDSENNSKKTTPVTGMPLARPRQSLSRTLSRISAPPSDKFMVEIPKSLADSFSASLQLIKRRINFEKIDEPKKQRFDEREAGVSKNKKTDFERVDAGGSTSKRTVFEGRDESKNQKNRDRKRDESKKEKKRSGRWKSLQEADNATIPRICTALKPVNSAEKETKEACVEGIRKSSRTRIPPIAYWVGNNSKDGEILFAPNQMKTKGNSRATVTRKEKQNLYESRPPSRVGQIKDIIKQKGKIDPHKSVHWEEDSKQESRNTHQMKVSFSMFNESVFVGADDEDDEYDTGVQIATSLQTRDTQSEFIRLLPGAQTTDLMSCNLNQLYTVLENTVLLYAEGAPKQFDLHSQFYVHKGVSHKLSNNSKNASLLLQVVIRK